MTKHKKDLNATKENIDFTNQKSSMEAIEKSFAPDKLKWEHNLTEESKAIAGTLARYNYESLVDEHNEGIDKAFQEGIKKTLEDVRKLIKKLQEPSNRFNLGLDNQESLAYFNGFEDTKEELKEQINKLEKTNG